MIARMRYLSRKGGFTIIELLVVITVIALLAAVTLAIFNKPKTDSRDVRREADMKELQNAIALYSTNKGFYPKCTSMTPIDGTSDCLSVALIAENAMPQVPVDPRGTGPCTGLPLSPLPQEFGYCYQTNALGNDYALYYHLENAVNHSGVPIGSGWYRINP